MDLYPGWVCQQLKNWYSSGYPARHLACLAQCQDWLAQCQYPVTWRESLIGNLYLSMAPRAIVWTDPSLRYTCMLLERKATNRQQRLSQVDVLHITHPHIALLPCEGACWRQFIWRCVDCKTSRIVLFRVIKLYAAVTAAVVVVVLVVVILVVMVFSWDNSPQICNFQRKATNFSPGEKCDFTVAIFEKKGRFHCSNCTT